MSRRLVGGAVAVLLAGGLVVYGSGALLRVWQMRQEIRALERDLEALRVSTEKLTQTVDRLRNDPGYIEKLGREELGMVREGETVLKFPSQQSR